MTSNIIPRLNMSVSSVKLSLGGLTNAESEPGVERVIGGQGPQMSEIAAELALAETAAKERTVNKITWVQWSSDRTGPNMFRFGWITITAEILLAGAISKCGLTDEPAA